MSGFRRVLCQHLNGTRPCVRRIGSSRASSTQTGRDRGPRKRPLRSHATLAPHRRHSRPGLAERPPAPATATAHNNTMAMAVPTAPIRRRPTARARESASALSELLIARSCQWPSRAEAEPLLDWNDARHTERHISRVRSTYGDLGHNELCHSIMNYAIAVQRSVAKFSNLGVSPGHLCFGAECSGG